MSNDSNDLKNQNIKLEVRQKLQEAEKKFEEGHSLQTIFTEIDQKLKDVIKSQKSSMSHELFNLKDTPTESVLKRFAKYYYEGLGDFDKAKEYYQRLNDLRVPSNILKGLGDCLRKKQMHNEAIVKYQAALVNIQDQQEEGEVQQLEISILNNKALSHLALSSHLKLPEEKHQELESARKALEDAVQKNESNVLSLCNLGKVCFQQGDWKKALELFKEAFQHNLKRKKIADAIEEAEKIYFNTMLPKLINLTERLQKDAGEFTQTIQFQALVKNALHEALGFEDFADEFREKTISQAPSENNKTISSELTKEYEKRFAIHDERISQLFAMSAQLYAKAEIQETNISKLGEVFSVMLVNWEKKVDGQTNNEEEREKLKNYFHALTETFSQVWITCQVINSRIIEVSPPKFQWDMVNGLISSLPLIPFVLKTILKAVMKGAQFKEAQTMKTFARRMTSLGSATQVDQKIGQAGLFIIEDRAYRGKILEVTEKKLEIFSSTLFKKKKKSWFKKKADQLDEKLYGELYKTPAARLGHRDANLLVLRWVWGQIAEEQIAQDLALAILNQENPYGAIGEEEPEKSKQILYHDNCFGNDYYRSNL